MPARIFSRLGLFSFVLLFWASFLSPFLSFAYATLAPSDEFLGNTLDTNIWFDYPNSGTINVNNSVLSLRQGTSRKFPFVISKNFTLNSGEFVEIKYKLFDPVFGTGIVFYDSPISNGTIALLNKTLIEIWPSTGGKIGVAIASLCDISETSCNRQYKYQKEYLADQEWHYARLERVGDIYRFSLDSELLLVSKPTSKTIGSLWFGNPEFTNTDVTFTKLDVDYVRVGVIVTPPEPLRPVVVIPGMFGSVNFGGLLRGENTNDWQVPTFITLYYNLINSLKNAGYVEGTNLFVFAYDWRKPLTDISVDLKNYIDGLIAAGKIGSGIKINFIGHSYGGLVGRTYAQANVDKVNKLIMAGSPNKGDINAYGVWEGGEAWGKWWQEILLWLSVQRLKFPGESRVDTVRRISPSIRDVLPTFDFLEQNGVPKPVDSMLQKNVFLPNLDGSIGVINGLTSIVRGSGVLTKEKVRVEDRSAEDQSLNKWEDGKPIGNDSFVKTDQGDEAVLLTSAGGLFNNKFTVLADHGGVIAGRPALEKIFEELGLDKNKVLALGALDTRESALAIGLRSPGTLNVCDLQSVCNENLGIYYPDEKLFIFPGYVDQDFDVSVAANGQTGNYTLETGLVTEGQPVWREKSDRLDSPNEVDNFTLTELFDTSAPIIIPYISPEPNAAGWNNSDVTVSWGVSDPDSPITSLINCGPTIVSLETADTEITCSATSYGGIASRTATVKLDKTKPVIIGSRSPEPNSHGWNNTDVVVSFTCSEVGLSSGLAENTVAGGSLTTEGYGQSMSNTGLCLDRAGNVALGATITGINVDKTDPVVVINAPDETTYALNSVVRADWTVSDTLSGLDGSESGTEPSGSLIATNSFGVKNFRVTATDLAGNTKTKIVKYTVGYSVVNFKPVLRERKTFKRGSTIPIRFQLKDAYGRSVPFVDARLYVNDIPAVWSGVASTDNRFRYDFFDKQYFFNLSTKMLLFVRGPYELEITLDGILSYVSTIVIK